jgi:hypothetical protein
VSDGGFHFQLEVAYLHEHALSLSAAKGIPGGYAALRSPLRAAAIIRWAMELMHHSGLGTKRIIDETPAPLASPVRVQSCRVILIDNVHLDIGFHPFARNHFAQQQFRGPKIMRCLARQRQSRQLHLQQRT